MKKRTLKEVEAELADAKQERASLITALTKFRNMLDDYALLFMSSPNPGPAISFRENEAKVTEYLKQFGVEDIQRKDPLETYWSKRLDEFTEDVKNRVNQAPKDDAPRIILTH